MSNFQSLWQFPLRRGNSNDPRNGACLLDAVSWFEYGTLGDHPACVCPVIAAFGRGINDAMRDTARQRLRVFIPRLVGTADPASEQARAEYLAWQAIRVFAPLALDAAGLSSEAQKLRKFSDSLHAAAAAAAYAAARTAAAANAAADAADAADAMIAALDGVLKIGRQAEPIEPARLIHANRTFAVASTR